MAIVSYTWEELEKMPSLTDWERLRNMKDEDIDYSDIPPLTDEDFARATRYGRPLHETIREKESKPVILSLKLTPNVLSAYRKMGRNWKTRLKTNVEQYLNQQVPELTHAY
ncbi:MAG: BrnA antitoxin family protein [Prevotellaceae bacterium]|jgi:uncharacterized protein (DUF4415 family)|nr:BrnA antitoxin family protein [Prevotellaceae bacterium]